MKILMCVNYAPAFLNAANVNEGWVSGILNSLMQNEGISIILAYPVSSGNRLNMLNDKLTCLEYLYDVKRNNSEAAKLISETICSENVDVIHIMGTEFPHSLFIFEICKELGLESRVVVSIQGLVSLYEKYYHTGVPSRYCCGMTLSEWYHGFNSLNKQQKRFKERGQYEIKLLSEVQNVIGRTSWDKEAAQSYNPAVRYFHNGENLRDAFYGGQKWDISKCDKHSIFVSQAYYSLKGLHHLLGVLPKIVTEYPDLRVYVGGFNPISDTPIKRDSYGRYLASLIRKGSLEGKIVFCGKMEEKKMLDRYLKCHVFVSPSNIENSSNSIGEALILGVPLVASDSGGTGSIVNDGIDGLLYPLTKPELMADHILRVFNDDSLALELSRNAVIRGRMIHDRDKNTSDLLNIYREITL